MFEITGETLKRIRLGEDTSLELRNLQYKGNQVIRPHRDSMADGLAAMANTTNGVFMLGVDDRSKEIVGIPLDKLDDVLSWIEDICTYLITPPLLCLIRKAEDPTDNDGKRAIVRVDVPKSLFVHRSPSGYFHRIGSSKRQMTPDALSRLFQRRSQTRMIRFDELAVTAAPRNCLEKVLWQKFKTPPSSANDEEFLLNLKLLTRDDDGNIHPSVSGVLMACERPQDFLTGAFIQAVAYSGTEQSSHYQLDARDIEGSLDVQIKEAYSFVQKNVKVYAVKEPARRDIPQYEPQAIFEALVNAVAHRDYSIHGAKVRLHIFSDRIEISSPGALVGTMTVGSLPYRQASRNELLTSLLARCPIQLENFSSGRNFLMDKRGEGVTVILSKSEDLSGQCPVYRLIDYSELVLTIYAAKPPHEESWL